MVGLRLLEEGVEEHSFEEQFGLKMEDVFGNQINRLIKMGLLEWLDKEGERHLRLTRQAWLLGNRVFREFIGLPKPPVIREQSHSTTTRVP